MHGEQENILYRECSVWIPHFNSGKEQPYESLSEEERLNQDDKCLTTPNVL